MQTKTPTLYIEINNLEYIFFVGKEDANSNIKIIYKCNVPSKGIENDRISDFELALNTIKKNIYLAEKELNFIFKETIVIINKFNHSFINLSGFKKLNGSQILKENITYILNSLKSNINEIEDKKKILHIFNSKFFLDKKEVTNLPIGLYGEFYSQELSFCLINNNDYKNLKNIFEKCNLKIKKVFLKSFVEGSYISNVYLKIDTFFKVKINENDTQIYYFENDSLKFEQNFNFGSDLIVKDISKVTSLKIDVVKKIISQNQLNNKTSPDELIEKNFFENENFRKIKKKLIFEIAVSRIQELAEVIFFKNINFVKFLKNKNSLFLEINDKNNFKCFDESYRLFFSKNDTDVKLTDSVKIEDLLYSVNKLVHFGWKKEAVPVIQTKKSIIARFFDTLFG